jgi:two-component system, LuxR family, response regulator FixJ
VKTRPDARVFIVDDDAGVLDSVTFLLGTVGIRAEAYASARDFLAACDPRTPGCVVLDVRMPGMSGLELQEKLHAMGSSLPVIFLTAHGDVPMAVKAVKAGAVDFIQKPFRDQDLIEKIQRALEQNARACSSSDTVHDIASRLESLTPREREVLEGVVAGKPNKAIADDLGVSRRTVEIHRARVMRKMKADSVAQLVHMVMRANGDSGAR